MSIEKLKNLVGEQVGIDGLGDATYLGAMRGHITFAVGYVTELTSGDVLDVPVKFEEFDEYGRIVQFEHSRCNITATGIERVTCVQSSNNNAFVVFDAGKIQRAFVFAAVEDLVSGSAPTTIVGITGTKAQFNTALTDGDFAYSGDAPTSYTSWLAGVGMFTDTGMTTPCANAGDAVLRWVADDGKVLSAINTPVCEYVDGVLTPCLEPVNNACFITVDDYDATNWEGHLVVGQTESGFGPHLATLAQESGFIGFDGQISVRNPASFGDTQNTTRSCYTNATMLGLSVTSTAQRVYVEGGLAKNATSGGVNFFAPGAATTKVQIGRFLTGGFRSSIYLKAVTLNAGALTAPQRADVLAAHRAYADTSKPKLMCVHDSMMALTILSGLKMRGAINLRLTRKYLVLPAGQSGNFLANSISLAVAFAADLALQGDAPVPAVVFVTNDLRGQSGAGTAGTAYGNAVVAWVIAQKAAGVINKAIWVRPPNESSDANFAAECLAANTVIAGSADVDDILNLATTVTTANGRLGSDQIHLTPSGAKFVAVGIEALL